MNNKIDQLRVLRDRLEAIQSDCAEALRREKSIGDPVDQALNEARRIYTKVSEGRVKAVEVVSDHGFLDHPRPKRISNNLGSIYERQ